MVQMALLRSHQLNMEQLEDALDCGLHQILKHQLNDRRRPGLCQIKPSPMTNRVPEWSHHSTTRQMLPSKRTTPLTSSLANRRLMKVLADANAAIPRLCFSTMATAPQTGFEL
jgi:hypothetical protein